MPPETTTDMDPEGRSKTSGYDRPRGHALHLDRRAGVVLGGLPLLGAIPGPVADHPAQPPGATVDIDAHSPTVSRSQGKLACRSLGPSGSSGPTASRTVPEAGAAGRRGEPPVAGQREPAAAPSATASGAASPAPRSSFARGHSHADHRTRDGSRGRPLSLPVPPHLALPLPLRGRALVRHLPAGERAPRRLLPGAPRALARAGGASVGRVHRRTALPGEDPDPALRLRFRRAAQPVPGLSRRPRRRRERGGHAAGTGRRRDWRVVGCRCADAPALLRSPAYLPASRASGRATSRW